MSESQDQTFDTRLLELHLGHLSREEQAALRERMAADPALAAQHDALASVFAALNAVPELRAPADLKDRILARVREAGPAPRVVRPADQLTETLERSSERVIRLGNFRDIIAVAALLVLAIGVGVPGLLHMRERSERMGCSWNLAQLGSGMQQYASTFNASLPFAGWDRQSYSWQPTVAPGTVNMPNRRHVYPLLRLAYVSDPKLFICPAQQDVPMPKGEIQRRSDFIEARNISYAYQNMAGVRPTLHENPAMPIMSDVNPLFADGMPLFDVRRLPWTDVSRINSRAHEGAGQNILALDGSVRWTTTPTCGIDGDNIWELRGVQDYTGHEGPQSATDSHLLK